MPNQKASIVASVLVNEFISRYGVPAEIHSGEISWVCSFNRDVPVIGHPKKRMTALHPLSDGMVELYNRTLGEQLAMFIGEQQYTWEQKLPLFLMSYRSAVHNTSGYTPSMLVETLRFTLGKNHVVLPAWNTL